MKTKPNPEPTQLTQEQLDLAKQVQDIYMQEVNYRSAVEFTFQKMKRERINDTPR